MSECIICKQDFDNSNIIWSECAHGPYCNCCYSIITSKVFPKCSICRRELQQTANLNIQLDSESGFNRYFVLEVIHRNNDSNIQNNNPPNQKQIYNEARRNRQRNYNNLIIPLSLDFGSE